MTLSERLRQVIETSGKSASCISRETRVTIPSITQFVREERGLSLVTADKLAKYFGLELTHKKGRPTHV